MDDDARRDHLLARAVLARTLKLGLQIPTPEALRPFRCGMGQETLMRAAAILEGAEGGELQATASAVAAALRPAGDEELARRYDTIFGHTARGRVCPYETEYGGDGLFQQAHALADLSGSYIAFGLTPSNDERGDHVACEFAFLEFLAMKELWAEEHGDAEMLEVTRAAARGFLKSHLARFGRAFGLALAREDPDGPHGRMGLLCAAFLDRLCRELEVPAGPGHLALRADGDDDVPMACGSSCGPCPPGP